jgi:predicted metalloprotease with PDZ domain
MTQYLGHVLAARAGLESQAEYRDKLAMTAANLDAKPGRTWRSTADTAVAASILRGRDQSWNNWRRGQDYYQEGELLWLDVDTTIRKQTDGKKSLDDFLKIFLGKGGNTGPEVVTYTFEDVVADLRTIVPYDWAKFFQERVYKITPRADMGGIEQGGYKLVYKEKPSTTQKTLQGVQSAHSHGGPDCWHSLGLRVAAEGKISDVRWNSPADQARVAPGYKLLAVNDQIYSADALRAAIRAAKGTTEPIRLIVQADNYVRTFDVNYHDGERYPVLERVEGSQALVDEITKPVTAPAKTDAAKSEE